MERKGRVRFEPWPDERLEEFIRDQIHDQGNDGNLIKPDGVCDARFDRLVNMILNEARKEQGGGK